MLRERICSVLGYGGCSAAFAVGLNTATESGLAFGFTSQEWGAIGVIGGLVIGIAGFLLNAYLAWRKIRRDRGSK